MEERKSKSVDIDKLSGVFFQIGLVIVLAVCLMAFEWKTYDKVDDTINSQVVSNFEEEIVQITKREEPPPPPKPEPVTTLIEIVEDDVIVEDDILVSTEADQTTEVNVYVAPVETGEQIVQEEEIFTIVEEQPGFPGGEEARIKFISQNTKYPQIAKDNGIEGKVFVTFVVEKDGRIANIKLLRDIGGGCGEEAIRVVKSMPNWTPGKQRGQPVRVQFNMPISFVLQ